MKDVMCKRCSQLIELHRDRWVTSEWPKGLDTCGGLSKKPHEPAAGTEGDAIVVDCSNHFGNRHEREIEEAESLSRATQPERPEPTAKKFNCVRCDFSSDDVIEAGNHGMACPIPSLEDAYESLKQSHASLVKALEGVLGVISTERGWGTWDRMESSALYEQASEAKKIADAALDTARKVQP